MSSSCTLSWPNFFNNLTYMLVHSHTIVICYYFRVQFLRFFSFKRWLFSLFRIQTSNHCTLYLPYMFNPVYTCILHMINYRCDVMKSGATRLMASGPLECRTKRNFNSDAEESALLCSFKFNTRSSFAQQHAGWPLLCVRKQMASAWLPHKVLN